MKNWLWKLWKRGVGEVSNLYLTADKIGVETGGGLVTANELEALLELGPTCQVMSQENLSSNAPEPFKYDAVAAYKVRPYKYDLCHIYSGTFGDTVRTLKKRGTKVAYTIAAHDKEVSKKEHEKLGMGFPYPHLVEPDIWKRYIEGYRLADVIICPGSVPAETVRKYGKEFENKRIEIVPHGCTLPDAIAPLPAKFTVGYCGAIGPDKGVRYLLEAWKRLNYTDALLCIAGKDSTSDFMTQLIQHFGGGPIWTAGWVNNISDFFSGISLYVQPSTTEGFGLEVLEAMAHTRPVLCSKAAGACDLVPESMRFDACDPRALAFAIDNARKHWDLEKVGAECRKEASKWTWEIVRQKYQQVWRSL